jgi:hypothetical protein
VKNNKKKFLEELSDSAAILNFLNFIPAQTFYENVKILLEFVEFYPNLSTI